MKKISLIILFVYSNIYAQSLQKESISFGFGLTNTIVHGDLRTTQTGVTNSENGFFNLGGYLYIDKMLTPTFGFEAKFNFLKVSGTGQEASGSYFVGTTPLSKTRFEGTAYGGEFNTIINLSSISSNPYRTKPRKLNFSALIGVGLHRYNSKLYNIETNELLADYGNSPSKNGTTTSLYFTSGLAIKYKISSKIDLELRQNFNLNNDDHLDAAVSEKQPLDFFFITNLGLVFKLNDKEHDNFIWQQNNSSNETILENDYQSIIDNALKDSDGDGVIDKFDQEKNTHNNAVVYANGVAIDSDKDGVQDYKDKCPLIYAKTITGCLPIDTDKDGVFDTLDQCPTVFAKTKNGCPKIEPKDTDGDGLVDYKDKCSTVYSKNKNGCPKKTDLDGDGIPDDVDKCPKIYSQNSDGCPKKIKFDSDRDGIPNAKDKCPLTFGKTKDGCPIKSDNDKDGISNKLDKCPNIYAKTKDGCPKKITPSKKKKPIAKPAIVTKKEAVKIIKKDTKVKPVKKSKINKGIKKVNADNFKHDNPKMDNSVNNNEITSTPIYYGCKRKKTEFDRKNCLLTKMRNHVLKNFKNNDFKAEKKRVRVLFIVDKNGSTIVINILANLKPNTKRKLKRIIESVPKMDPGLLENTPVSVKFSELFDLE